MIYTPDGLFGTFLRRWHDGLWQYIRDHTHVQPLNGWCQTNVTTSHYVSVIGSSNFNLIKDNMVSWELFQIWGYHHRYAVATIIVRFLGFVCVEGGLGEKVHDRLMHSYQYLITYLKCTLTQNQDIGYLAQFFGKRGDRGTGRLDCAPLWTLGNIIKYQDTRYRDT